MGKPKRKDSPREYEDDEMTEGYVPTSPVSPIFLFGLFLFALFLLFAAEELVANHLVIKQVFEHTASALIVASVIGFSYEYLVHRYRARTLRNLLHNQREKMYDALRVYMLTTPEEILNLLEEIAQQTNQIPTLYSPTRAKEKGDEYTFAKKIRFFDTLIDVRRKEVINVLRNWIGADKDINLRFLATDFIGRYQLRELEDEVRIEALLGAKGFKHWQSLSTKERFCILNYMWAASRCEIPKYKWLKDRLLESEDPEIQEWILFVPQQMPEDQELVDIIRSYLERQRHPALPSAQKEKQPQNLALAACGLAALERKSLAIQSRETQGNARKILVEFADLFKSSSSISEIQDAWRDIGIPKEIKNEEN